jgi:hypothetical protein
MLQEAHRKKIQRLGTHRRGTEGAVRGWQKADDCEQMVRARQRPEV